jgi:predicted RNA methylase
MSRKNTTAAALNSPSCEDDDDDDEEEWADEQAEDENLDFFPICSPSKPQKSLISALDHDEQQYNFSLLEFLPSVDDDDFFEKTIICINKSRAFVQDQLKNNSENNDIGDKLKEYLKKEQEKKNNNDDDDDDGNFEFFKPVIEDDHMLMCMDDLEDIIKSKGDSKIKKDENTAVDGESTTQMKLKIKALEEQLHRTKEYIATLTDSYSKDGKDKNSSGGPKTKGKKQDNDTYYFSSYSYTSIHETMLKDTIRTKAYQSAILSNKHLFKDKVVIDIGCGTGILSLFAAQAGAKKVIAIDASDVHAQAREIIDLNGYGDVIQVVHGKVEDLILNQSLPLEDNEKVDVVISEWMGYALLYETMLPSVMAARDNFMDKDNGTMWPNKSNMFIEGATDSRLEYWDDVYGMNMAPMKMKLVKELCREANVEIVDGKSVVTNRDELILFDLNKCNDKDLDFESPFKLQSNNSEDSVKVDKLVISFDVDFNLPECNPVSFSTSCQTEPTHWKQTTLWFNPDEAPLLESGEILKGFFTMGRNDINPRDMDFIVRWEVGVDDEDFKPRCAGTIISRLIS